MLGSKREKLTERGQRLDQPLNCTHKVWRWGETAQHTTQRHTQDTCKANQARGLRADTAVVAAWEKQESKLSTTNSRRDEMPCCALAPLVGFSRLHCQCRREANPPNSLTCTGYHKSAPHTQHSSTHHSLPHSLTHSLSSLPPLHSPLTAPFQLSPSPTFPAVLPSTQEAAVTTHLPHLSSSVHWVCLSALAYPCISP